MRRIAGPLKWALNSAQIEDDSGRQPPQNVRKQLTFL